MANPDLPVIVVKRSEWGRGGIIGYLRNPKTGTQCCLGFVAREAGYSEADINGKADICSIVRADEPVHPLIEKLVRWASSADFYACSDLGARLEGVNDQANLSEEERERELSGLARQAGFEFRFVD